MIVVAVQELEVWGQALRGVLLYRLVKGCSAGIPTDPSVAPFGSSRGVVFTWMFTRRPGSVEGHPHTFRHAYITLLASKQVYAGDHAGHRDTATTEKLHNYVLRAQARDRVDSALAGDPRRRAPGGRRSRRGQQVTDAPRQGLKATGPAAGADPAAPRALAGPQLGT